MHGTLTKAYSYNVMYVTAFAAIVPWQSENNIVIDNYID